MESLIRIKKAGWKRSHIAIFGILWVFIMALGIVSLERYARIPGDKASVPQVWPKKTKIEREHTPTLLVFLHPECSCSEATVEELNKLLGKVQSKVKVYAVFAQPEGWSINEVKSGLWKQVGRIPNVERVVDTGRKEAFVFGALTSGHTLLYDNGGRLAFSGGITESRGHVGDNLGEDTIVGLLNNQKMEVSQTNIFGCGLFEEQ